MDDIPVPKHVGRQIAVQIVPVIFLDVVLLGLVPRHERTVGHVVYALDPGLQLPRLLLRQAVVHEGQYCVLLLEIRQIGVGVVCHQRKGTHN